MARGVSPCGRRKAAQGGSGRARAEGPFQVADWNLKAMAEWAGVALDEGHEVELKGISGPQRVHVVELALKGVSWWRTGTSRSFGKDAGNPIAGVNDG